MLVSVLDGKGFVSSNAFHGERGYEQDIVFNWVGATTPIPDRTHSLMVQLSTHLAFYEAPTTQPADADLIAYAERDDYRKASDECQAVASSFPLHFFAPIPSQASSGKASLTIRNCSGSRFAWGEGEQ